MTAIATISSRRIAPAAPASCSASKSDGAPFPSSNDTKVDEHGRRPAHPGGFAAESASGATGPPPAFSRTERELAVSPTP